MPALWLSLAVLCAVLIAILAIYMVSSRHRVREIEIMNDLRARLDKLAATLGAEYRSRCEKALAEAVTLLDSSQVANHPLPAMKSLSIQYPIIRYPFILNADGTYVFPFSRVGTSPIFTAPDRITQNSGIGLLFRRGKEREENRDLVGAIRLYLEALDRDEVAPFTPRLNAAIGRSYLKMNRLPQAERFFHIALGDTSDLRPQDPDLFLIIQRQLALISKLSGDREKALARYLELYESSVEMEVTPNGKRYEFFRNEATDVIERYSTEIASLPSSRLPEPISRFMNTRSSLDLSLQWLYFEVDPDVRRDSGLENDASRRNELIRLSNLYTSDSEKTRFYRAVKSASILKRLTGRKEVPVFQGVTVEGEVIPLCLVWIEASRCFGFTTSNRYIAESLVPLLAPDSIGGNGLSVRFRSAAEAENMEKSRDHVLLSAIVKAIPGSPELILLSESSHYLRDRIRREMVLNYFLIGVLILLMVGGITLWLQYERRERQLIRSKSEFLNLAAHTLRTPITRLSLLAENLRSGWVSDPGERNEFLDAIGTESRHMNELIENLLNFARIDAGKKRYSRKKIRLYTVVQGVLSRYESYLSRIGFTMSAEIDPAIPPQWLDAVSMEMVVAGLLENAVKYSRGEKNIHVSLVGEDSEAVLKVRDRGMGIRAGEISRVFDRFFRSDSPEVRSIEGSGLGLFLARHAVQAHGGEMKVESEPGKGTVFTIRLPIPGDPDDPMDNEKRQAWKKS